MPRNYYESKDAFGKCKLVRHNGFIKNIWATYYIKVVTTNKLTLNKYFLSPWKWSGSFQLGFYADTSCEGQVFVLIYTIENILPNQAQAGASNTIIISRVSMEMLLLNLNRTDLRVDLKKTVNVKDFSCAVWDNKQPMELRKPGYSARNIVRKFFLIPKIIHHPN